MIYKHRTLTNIILNGNDYQSDSFESCKFTNEIKFVNFNNCRFINCDFSTGIYNITSFSNCDFIDCKLSNIDFLDISFKSCNFKDCVMENCVFQKKKLLSLKTNKFDHSNLSRTAFVYSNLDGVSFNGCDLRFSVFERCSLVKTDFSSADILGIGFENCKIDNTILDINGFISFGNTKGFVITS